MTSKERITIALMAGIVAQKALEFTEYACFVDDGLKKMHLNSLIDAVEDLKKNVMSTTAFTASDMLRDGL